MTSQNTPDVVTPRAQELTLRPAAGQGAEETARHGEPLRIVARLPNREVEVQYRGVRWLAAEEALEPWQRDSVAGFAPRPAEAPPSRPPAVAGPGSPLAEMWRAGRLMILGSIGVALLVILLPTGLWKTPAGWLACEGGARVEALHLGDAEDGLVTCAGGRLPRGPLQAEGRPEVAGDAPAQAQPVPATATPEAAVRTAPASPAAATSTQTVASPTAPPATTPVATPTPAPTARPPQVTQLAVCDGSVDCGGDNFSRERESLTACLTVTPGADPTPLVLVATDRDQAPASAGDATVFARSGPVEQRPSFACHALEVVRRDISPGTYWLWVLAGTDAVTRAAFQVRAAP